jgi:sulfate adenylyltransferase
MADAQPTPPNHEPQLISPYGGVLVDLMVAPEERAGVRALAHNLPSLQLSPRSVCDLELLATGAFSPVTSFMGEADYRRVVREMRLADGRLFPIPITLPVAADKPYQIGQQLALRDQQNELLGVLTIDEIYPWERDDFARLVLGTEDQRHPLVAEMQQWGPLNLSGQLRILRLPRAEGFAELRLTPRQVRDELANRGHTNVVAFQTRNPMHRVHEELTRRAAESVDGTLLLHPAVGMTKPGDIDHYSRVRTYQLVTERYFEQDRVLLALLPLAMRMAGPREAVWHALIRRNYGANHFIVGRDHASPGSDSTGKPFYHPDAARELVEHHAEELGVKVVPFEELVYLPDEDRYEEVSQVPAGTPARNLSGTEVRENYLERGIPLPDWYTRPEVAAVLQRAYPPRHEQGVCVWFTGLSGAGKSTVAGLLTSLLLAAGRRVTLLDGDVVRTSLSSGLGFSKADRDLNIRRIGYVAAEIVRHGGVAICAAVSPYRAARNEVREMVGRNNFVEVYVDTPLAVCEARDTKGMYARARRGEVKNFTGIDDPYEAPVGAEVVLDGDGAAAEESARKVRSKLKELGFLEAD